MPKSFNVKQYLRKEKMPHIWCPGCGIGIVASAFLRAVDELELNPDDMVAISGIGCSSRITGYLDFNTLHTTHGRGIAFATGIKLSNPGLNVVMMAGDGDATAIGGNHLLHACRRNLDITLIIFNNGIYGMTGGQYSPLTMKGDIATTTPYGNLDTPFDISSIVREAGATFVARGITYYPVQLEYLIRQGLSNKGFSVVEVLTQCPTYYGRMNNMGTAVDMLKRQKDNTISTKAAAKMPPEAVEGKILTGVLHTSLRPEYSEEYKAIVEKESEKVKANELL